jgi:hypothetical protein
MDLKQVFIRRRLAKAQKEQKTADQKRRDSIHNVPKIALWVANILVLSLDYRVVEAVYQLTDNIMLSIFALFTSGMMFILWFDVLYRYLLKNDKQNYISIAFSGLSLVSAGVFAFLDYGLSAGYGVEKVLPVEANLLFAGMVILTIANGAGLFAWYIFDDQVERKSKVEKNRADNDFDAETIEEADKLLEKAGVVLQRKEAMEKRFGKEAVGEIMDMLSGIEDLLGVDLNNDGKIGNRPQMTANASDTSAALQLKEAPRDPNPPKAGNES